MSKGQFTQRRDGRVAALQYLYAWSLNAPADLAGGPARCSSKAARTRATITPSARS